MVQINPLNSADALKMAKELSQTSDEGRQTPIITSLFDVKGNSKFKNGSKSETSDDPDSSGDDSSDDNEEEKKSSTSTAKIVFKSLNSSANGGEAPKTYAFSNPFVPKSGISNVFQPGKSLFANPFGQKEDSAATDQTKPA